MRRRVAICSSLPGDPVRMLCEENLPIDIDLFEGDCVTDKDDLMKFIAGADVVIAPLKLRIDAAFMEAAGDRLRLIANFGVGTDNIDLAEAASRSILVSNTPDAVTEPTADIAWLLLLGAARLVRESMDHLHEGLWTGFDPFGFLGRRLVETKILVVGGGRIGTAVARRAVGWNMDIMYTQRSRNTVIESDPIKARYVSLDEGLQEADVVTIHVPLTEQTRGMFDSHRLGLMKLTSILVNTSRGPVIDEQALVEALDDGRIMAAGLDVFEEEPVVHPGLIANKRAFCLPHVGSATMEDRAWMTRQAVDNAIAVLQGNPPPNEVRVC